MIVDSCHNLDLHLCLFLIAAEGLDLGLHSVEMLGDAILASGQCLTHVVLNHLRWRKPADVVWIVAV